MKRYLLLIVGGLLGVIADQATKLWAVKALLPEGLPKDASDIRSQIHVVTDTWFNFRLAGNKGAAWGMFRDLPESYRVAFFVVISVAAIAFIVKLYSGARSQPVLRWALMFILGGAIGNLLDRIRLGYVVDFIDWYQGASHWPTFNIADVGITIGVALMIVDILVQSRKSKGERETEQMLE